MEKRDERLPGNNKRPHLTYKGREKDVKGKKLKTSNV